MDAKKFLDITSILTAGEVVRYHNKPHVPKQTVADHSFNMILCCLSLHPNPSINLLKAIAYHDLPEILYGDFSFESKHVFPEIKAIDIAAQKHWFEVNGIGTIDLEPEEIIWLKFLDNYEVLQYLGRSFSHGLVPEHIQVIVNDTIKICNALEEQLKTFGYFTDPKETKH